MSITLFIKNILPEPFKKSLRRCESFFMRLTAAFTSPIIMTGKDGIKIVVYPDNSSPLRWFVEKSFNVKEMLAIQKLSLKHNEVFFDVGANIGAIALPVAKMYKSVIAFEPFLPTYHLLEENVCVNHFTNITMEQIAFSNKAGSLDFYFDPANSEINSLGNVFENKETSPKTTVEVSTLDAYCQQHSISTIDFLKIDTEGFEIEVLEGASRMLSSGAITYIQFEISAIPLTRLGKNSQDIFKILSRYGYHVYDFSEKENRFMGPVLSTNTHYNNFFASKEDLAKL